ncbi:MAG TPA: SLBB domain-containing protein [Bacteroidales bacterium]|nr:SLBB domain-containing protein [Bacteroidales bacterium]HPS17643.1 SLBB domain-containing protein [Bacteroidales bacterium]
MEKYKNIIIVFVLVIFTSFYNNAFSQSQKIDNVDLSKVKVDELSDTQVKAIAEKAGMSGMSEDQIETLAKAKGMSDSEILKLKSRISKLKTTIKDDNSSTGRTRSAEVKNDSLDKEVNPYANKIFGFSLFTNKSLTFEPSTNIATPLNYQLGPGDKLIIDVWGASQETYEQKITAEGYIIISNVGPIYLSGMTIEQATNKVKKELTSIYTGLSIGNTFLKVSLGAVRSIKVNIVGEVALPGTYTLSSLATALNALYVAGGPSENGSLRNVKIIRNNKTVAELDIYEFLLKGELPKNMRLQDEDVIFIPAYDNRVEIKGEVKRTGLFDLKTSEKLKDLIYYAGGYTDKAYTENVKVLRKTGKQYKVFDVPSIQQDSFKLSNGDEVSVDTVLNKYENRVEIKGAVNRPGIFALDNNTTLGELIRKASGLREDAFKSRVIIYRTLDDLTIKTIPVEIKDTTQSYQTLLLREDVVSVSSIFDIQEEYTIKIDGEVRVPGEYPYTKNTTIEDLIVKAGGLLESASYAKIEVDRRIKDNYATASSDKIAEVYQFQISKDLKVSDSASNFELMPFDNVFIRKSPGYSSQSIVKVDGEVLFPGFYSITTKTERISDLIKRAGSTTPEAYVKGARLTRQNSAAKKLQLKDIEKLKERVNDTLPIDDQTINKTETTISIDLEKILKKAGSKYDLFLEKGDVIKIPKEPQTVGLSGALLYPVVVRYMKGYGVRKYISSSGGFSDDAKPSKIYVVNINGSVKRTSRFLFIKNYPKVEPGAEIVVPQKTLKKGMSTTEAIGFGTAMSSLALIIITIVNALK